MQKRKTNDEVFFVLLLVFLHWKHYFQESLIEELNILSLVKIWYPD